MKVIPFFQPTANRRLFSLIFTLVLSVATYSSIQAQVFEPALGVPLAPADGAYPTLLTPDQTHTSAHSYNAVSLGAQLYVHSWDDTDGYVNGAPTSNGGIAFTQTVGGVTTAQDVVYLNDIASLEAVIVEETVNNLYYVFASYYSIGNQEFLYDVYEWNGTSLLPISTMMQVIPGLPGPYDFDYIRADAVENFYANVWVINGEMYAAACNVNAGVSTLTTPIRFDPHPDWPNGYTQPDIAIAQLVDLAAPLSGIFDFRAAIVANDASNTSVAALDMSYFDILNVITMTPPATPYTIMGYVTPVLGLSAGQGVFRLPRIDAMDKSGYISPISGGAGEAVWSYVVHEETPNEDFIHTFIHDGYLSKPKMYYRLNDNTLPFAIPFLQPPSTETKTHILTSNPQYSSKPVVAIEQLDFRTQTDGDIGIYYGWYHITGENPPFSSPLQSVNKSGYIGLKITTDAQYSLFTPSDRYFVIPQQKEEIADRPSLAFSGNNDVNLGSLYAAFSQTDGSGVMPITNYIGYKSIPWTRLSYRPAAVNELNVLDIQAYPNPFSKRFTLAVVNAHANTVYELRVSDVLGRVVLEKTGNIAILNEALSLQSESWNSQQYIFHLKDSNTGNKSTIKLLKVD